MGIGMLVILMWSLAFYFTSAVYAREGDAVYYEPPYIPSACYQSQDKWPWVAGVRDELWENRAACGRRYRVRCIGPAFGNGNPCEEQQGNGVVVQIVDYCRAPCNGIINLSQDAFNKIADLRAERIKVSIRPDLKIFNQRRSSNFQGAEVVRSVVGEKITYLTEYATNKSLPLIKLLWCLHLL